MFYSSMNALSFRGLCFLSSTIYNEDARSLFLGDPKLEKKGCFCIVEDPEVSSTD